jgi:hypothetical protein
VTERLPPPDESLFPPLASRHVRVLPSGHLIGRIHATSGRYPIAWSDFRHFGPMTARFDHQPLPRRLHPTRGVMYATPVVAGKAGQPLPVLRTCVAEVFRERGVVELSRDAPFFVLFRLARPVRVLDLTDSDWLTLAGGNAAIASGPRGVARDWSRAIYGQYADIDGLYYGCSTVPPARSIALYERAADATPSRPSAHLPLSHPALRAELEAYASELRLGLVG